MKSFPKLVLTAALSSLATLYVAEHDKELVAEVQRTDDGRDELVVLKRHKVLPVADERLGGIWVTSLKESPEGSGYSSGLGYVNYLSEEFRNAGFLAKFMVNVSDRRVTILTFDSDGDERIVSADLPRPFSPTKLSYY